MNQYFPLFLRIASIAGMLLSTEYVTSNYKNPSSAPQMPPMGGGMDGMM